MIIEIDGKRVRREGWEVWRKRGDKSGELYLMMLINSRTYPDAPIAHWGFWHVPAERGGDLATTGPEWADCYAVSWRKLPEDFRLLALTAIEHVRKAGTPHSRDESIFA